MVSSSPRPASHYRRRILALGAVATGALYVIGAPIFNRRIEDDLERRVPAELAAAGYGAVTASFSGQDGTLTCDAPLDDPEAARAAAFDVRGVRDIVVDRSCRVNSAPEGPDADVDATVTTPTTTSDEGSEGEIDDADESEDDTVTTPATSTDDVDDTSTVDLATVADVVAANPDLAFLSVLLDDVDLGRSADSVTLFAPNNDAFDAVPADVLGRLQRDDELFARVLDHHVVAGVVFSDELASGELTALDGTPIAIEAGDPVTIGGAPLVEPDIVASNGVVHVIGALLLPPDLSLVGAAETAPVTATYDGATIALVGVVASEVERRVLVDAAVAAVGDDAVDDQLTVDPETGVGAPEAADVASLIAALPGNVLSGEVGFDGDVLFANGIAASPDGETVFVAAADAVDASSAVTPPPEATEDDAAELEAALNAFVAENPILFEPSSAVLSDSSSEVLDRIAGDAQQLAGISITVEGHTDSDGIPTENLALSQDRADAVRDELTSRGLDPDSIEAVGFGSEQPVLVDGVEDKAASRRVEFRVVTS